MGSTVPASLENHFHRLLRMGLNDGEQIITIRNPGLMCCCFTTLEKILRLVPLVQISFDLVRQGDKPFWQEDDDEDQEEPDNNKPQVCKSE